MGVDPDWRQTLVDKYNELYNSTRPREYNGSHIIFSGMNPEIQLREHQLNAVAHILYGGNKCAGMYAREEDIVQCYLSAVKRLCKGALYLGFAIQATDSRVQRSDCQSI
jgi:hypothetical protein